MADLQDVAYGVTDLPDALLGLVCGLLDSPKDRLSALLTCKRWLAAAAAHQPLWEELAVSDGRGVREGRFWAAHSQQVSSLVVSTSGAGGGPGVFLRFLLDVAGPSGLPRLESLEVQVPGGRNPGIVAVWFRDAFQAINRLRSLRRLRIADSQDAWDNLPHWDFFSDEQSLPLLLEPGALSCLESLEVESPAYWGRTVDIPEGALAGLSQLRRLELSGNLVRSGAPRPGRKPAAAPAPPCSLGWPDLQGTTALRCLRLRSGWAGQLELSESEALSALCQLEALEVGDPERVGPGVWAALPQLTGITRIAIAHKKDKVYLLSSSDEHMLAAAACPGLRELVTNWLPPLGPSPPHLSSLTVLTFTAQDYPPEAQPDPSWGHALPSLRICLIWGNTLPPWLSCLSGSLQRLSVWLDYDSDLSPLPGMILEPILGLTNLTRLDLRCTEMSWEVPEGPYLSTLVDLSVLRVDAAAPIPPALAAATCLSCLCLFPYCTKEEHTRNYSDSWYEPGAPDPAAWGEKELALLRALPCLRKMELVDSWACWWYHVDDDGDRQLLKPEWQESAQVLRQGLAGAGVEVVARRATKQELADHSWKNWLHQPTH